jgi:hypothetical protein
MRVLLLSAMVLAACATEKAPEAESEAPMDAPAGLAVADLAGTWSVAVMGMTSDSVVLTGQVVGAGDPLAFTMQLGNRAPMPVSVAVDGDSVMIATMAPYESMFRPGVMVTNSSTARMVDGRLEGVTTGHYQVETADSVAQFRSVWTRVP